MSQPNNDWYSSQSNPDTPQDAPSGTPISSTGNPYAGNDSNIIPEWTSPEALLWVREEVRRRINECRKRENQAPTE